jgi:hypothetical protein
MMDIEVLKEKIEMYCDADRRGRIESSNDRSPALGEIIDTLAHADVQASV